VPFRSHRPVPPLQNFIENFWLYDGYSSAYMRERIFPTGAFEFVFNLRDDELRIYDSKPPLCSRYSGALVSGPYDGFFLTDRAEKASTMGVHFRPGGAFPFLGISAYVLANTHIDLVTIWSRPVEKIREQLALARSPEHRFQLLENALLTRLRRSLEHHPAVSLALHVLHSGNSRVLVRKLVREAGVSDRRFVDVVRAEVGLNPKLFHRVQRFSYSAASLSFFFTRTTVTFENPSSNVGGRSFPAIRRITSSSTIRCRRRLRSRHTSRGTSKNNACTSYP